MVAARTSNISKARTGMRAVPSRDLSSQPRKTRRVSWESRLRPELQPKVVEDSRHSGTLLLPTPLLVGEVVTSIPRGQVWTMRRLRARLAERFGAASACPLTTGACASILAGAVAEDLGHSRLPRWPIWRLVRDDGTLHPKWPLDALYRATRLREESVRLTNRRGRWAALDTQDP